MTKKKNTSTPGGKLQAGMALGAGQEANHIPQETVLALLRGKGFLDREWLLTVLGAPENRTFPAPDRERISVKLALAALRLQKVESISS